MANPKPPDEQSPTAGTDAPDALQPLDAHDATHPSLPRPLQEQVAGPVILGVGGQVGSYRLVRKLGEGGVGVVYEAQHALLSRRAAIKVLRPEFSQNPDMIGRFFREAESANLVGHPGIVAIFEFLRLPDQTACIVMEFLEGESLAGRLKQRGRLGVGGLPLMRQVASALAAAHGRGIVHRDMKPDNVMIVSDPDVPGGERAKIVDFGIAKARGEQRMQEGPSVRATFAGQIMGTPAYMSPEQFRDTGGVDDRADVYSVGVMLYEVLGGKLPFTAPSFSELAALHLYFTPTPLSEVDPTLPAALSALVDRMLHKDAAVRPSMAEVATELSRVFEASTASTTLAPPPAAPPLVAPPPPPRAPLGMIAGVVGVLALAGGAAWVALRPAPQPVVVAPPVAPPKPEPPKPIDLAALRAQAQAVLEEGLRDPDPQLRRRAVGLVAFGRTGALAARVVPLLGDAEPAVQAEAAEALGQLGERALVPALREALDQGGLPEEVRLQVAGALLQFGDPRGEALLRKALRGRDADLQRRAAQLLAARDRKARELLLGAKTLDDDGVAALGRLMRAGDAEAAQALRAALEGDSPLRLRVAEELARGDEASARGVLEGLAGQPGAQRLQAARLLAGLDDPSFFDLFKQALQGGGLAERVLAAEGLGVYRRRDGAPLLSVVLPREAATSQRLRLTAAGSLLLIAGADPTLQQRDSLARLQGGLSAAAADERAAAATAVGDAEPREALPLLTRAIADPEAEVRSSAARALGRTRVREAVPVLDGALADGVEAVRTAALSAMGQVGQHLRARGESVDAMEQAMVAKTRPGDAHMGVAAEAARVQMGKPCDRDKVRGWIHEHRGDAELRQKAVQVWGDDATTGNVELIGALRDRAFGVRFAAAAGLARRGVADGVEVLRGALDAPGAEAVVARGLLLKLGQPVPGEVTLDPRRSTVEERVARVAATASLPQADALLLLRKAALDVASQVRLRAVEVLGDLTGLLRTPLGQRVLNLLIADREPVVRSHAGLLASRLALSPTPAPAPEPTPAPAADLAPPADLPPPGDLAAPVEQARGHLALELEPEVRFQVDRRAPQGAPSRPLGLSVGKHKISWAGGSAEVEVRAGETQTFRVPLTTGEQLLADAAAAFESGDAARAGDLLSRAQGLLGKVRLSRAQAFSLRYYQARLSEEGGRLVAAMGEYEKLARAEGATEKQRADLKAGAARLAGRLGRLRVAKEGEGGCQVTELWVMPGAHMLDVDGARREVRVKAGEVVAVGTCK